MTESNAFIWYNLFRDFAGPAATVVASITVAIVTFRLQDRQATVAETKMRYELFGRVYDKLLDVKHLLTLILNATDLTDLDRDQIWKLKNSLDEGRFLLSAATVRYVRAVSDSAELIERLLILRSYTNVDDAPGWRAIAEELTETNKQARILYERAQRRV